MPIEPHRIEAAARAMLAAHDWTEGGAYSGGWETMPAGWQEAYRVMAAAAIAAAHPELAAGTAWVAPWHATEEMEDESDVVVEVREHSGLSMKSAGGWIYAAMRDAHLSKGKDDDHG